MQNKSIQEIENRAIDSAIRSDWDGAISVNLNLLKLQKDNIPALLRLGFAYLQLSKYDLSHDMYRKVLRLQPQNSIASEYIAKIELRKKQGRSTSSITLDTNMFIEVPGKTKTITLGQLGQKAILAKLTVGEEIMLSIRKHHVELRTVADEYVGVLPDDVGVRLMYFMENKSIYKVNIREATLNIVIVFIREIEKGPKVAKLISFPLDIPGSISNVMARQQADEDHLREKSEGQKGHEDEGKSEEETLEEDEKEDDDLEGELLKDLEGDQKPETEMLGIETDEEDEEEE